MISFGLTPQQFSQRFRKSLDGLSKASILRIRNLLNEPTPIAIRSAEVQVFVDTENYGTPSLWLYFVGDNVKTSQASREVQLGLEELEEVDEQYFTNFAFGGPHLMADALKTWFAECWWKAGGWDYGVPVDVDVHDGYGDGHKIHLSEASS